jgi:predicted RNase H-like nuclease
VSLLRSVGLEIPSDIGEAGRAAVDDVLDATAVAWSALRIASGEAQFLPETPERDPSGRSVAIWY